ncbi:MAG: hypothetical protein KatS3mg087_0841 [Patescibacteria group bacterium]|nr:MAG: hypothetical protein KatS3mg087_0841 [Patescibacteria group bacterium]
MTEYETKVLNINVPEITTKLQNLGATKVQDYFYKRYTYDFEVLKSSVGWIRLRTDGHAHTLTYKAKKSNAIDGIEEIETAVADFNHTHEIILKLKPYRISYWENKRTLYQLNDLEFCLDTWPLAPTWLEVESDSIEKVEHGLRLLDLQNQAIGNLTPWQTFKEYYQLDLSQYEYFTFETQKLRHA